MKFVNAQEMAANHPKTFHAPSQEEVGGLEVGDNVMVSVANERFWCWIIALCGDEVIAKINNDLLHSHVHCLFCDDVIRFNKKRIFKFLK